MLYDTNYLGNKNIKDQQELLCNTYDETWCWLNWMFSFIWSGIALKFCMQGFQTQKIRFCSQICDIWFGSKVILM